MSPSSSFRGLRQLSRLCLCPSGPVDCAALPSLYALKLYELHKLSGLESLTRSHICCLAASSIADKITGSKLAGTLPAMPKLERTDLTFADRSGSWRYTILENQLRKAGRLDLLTAVMDYQAWERL